MTARRVLLVCALLIGCGDPAAEEPAPPKDAGAEPALSREQLERQLDQIEQEISGESPDY